jgi:hypothetical protein
MENNNEFPIPSLPEQEQAPAPAPRRKQQNKSQSEQSLQAELNEMGFTGDEADELKDYLNELDTDGVETKESFNGEYPFYKTTLGISIISVVALVILLLVLKYTGMFDIMSLF